MWPGNRCVECFEYPNLPRFGQTWECFYIDDVPGWCLGDIQRKLKDLCVGLAEVDEAGGNKRIHKFIQLELSNPILIQFAPFVTTTQILSPYCVLSLRISSIMRGCGFDCSNMNFWNSIRENDCSR